VKIHFNVGGAADAVVNVAIDSIVVSPKARHAFLIFTILLPSVRSACEHLRLRLENRKERSRLIGEELNGNWGLEMR